MLDTTEEEDPLPEGIDASQLGLLGVSLDVFLKDSCEVAQQVGAALRCDLVHLLLRAAQANVCMLWG